MAICSLLIEAWSDALLFVCTGELRGNILLTFVHMMDVEEIPSLLSEGLLSVLYNMLQSTAEFSRCAAAHAIKHLVPAGYDPDVTIDVPPYLVDDHEELFLNSSLSDLQFLVKGHIAPINAHKVVLFFRNSYFKNVVRVSIVTPKVVFFWHPCLYIECGYLRCLWHLLT